MTCPAGECIPVDVAPPFGAGSAEPGLRPYVRCAVCGAQAEWVSPVELAEAWGEMLASRPVEGQTSWLG